MKKPKWEMPFWMAKYRHLINNTGGNSIEDLMNDNTTTVFSNAPRAIICCCVNSQITLLTKLKNNEIIK